MAVPLHGGAAIVLCGKMKIRLKLDLTAEHWRYDVRLFVLAYIFGIIAFSALVP